MNGHTEALDPYRARVHLCVRIARGIEQLARARHWSLPRTLSWLAERWQCRVEEVRALYTKPRKKPSLGLRQQLEADSREWPGGPIRVGDW